MSGAKEEAALRLGQLIRTRRRALEYTQEGLAEELVKQAPGIPGFIRSAIAQWENNYRVPSAGQLYIIGQVLGLTPIEYVLCMEMAATAENAEQREGAA